MGLLQKIGGVLSGGAKAAANTFDVTWDVVSAAWDRDDDDDESFFGNLGHFINQASILLTPVGGGADRFDADVLAAARRKREGGTRGAAFGATGRLARDSVSKPIGAGLESLNTLYREGVAEPLSTAFTFGSLMDDKKFQDGLKNKPFFERVVDTFQAADDIAEHRSPGQAAVLMFLTDTITNPEQVAEAEDTETFQWLSGITDIGVQLYLDPTSKVSKTVRVASVVTAVGTTMSVPAVAVVAKAPPAEMSTVPM